MIRGAVARAFCRASPYVRRSYGLTYSKINRSCFVQPVIRLNSSSSSNAITTEGTVIPKSVLEMAISDYHQYADDSLENMLIDLEDLMDEKDCTGLDVELSNGILQMHIPNKGDYVINKQPANKQIWLASPVSGPKRFDYIDGEWISLRDQSKLLDLVGGELSDGLGFDFEFTKE